MPACTIGRTFTCTERTLCCLQLAAGALFTPWTCALHLSLGNERRPQKLPYGIQGVTPPILQPDAGWLKVREAAFTIAKDLNDSKDPKHTLFCREIAFDTD